MNISQELGRQTQVSNREVETGTYHEIKSRLPGSSRSLRDHRTD